LQIRHSVFFASTPLLCGSSTGEVSHSSDRFDHDSLREAPWRVDSRFSDQRAHLHRSTTIGRLAQCANRTAGGANLNSERLFNSEAVLAVPQERLLPKAGKPKPAWTGTVLL